MKLTITAKKDGFRRAGRAWKGTTTVDADKFTKEQIAALKAEPMLVVAEPPEEKKAAKPGGQNPPPPQT